MPEKFRIRFTFLASAAVMALSIYALVVSIKVEHKVDPIENLRN